MFARHRQYTEKYTLSYSITEKQDERLQINSMGIMTGKALKKYNWRERTNTCGVGSQCPHDFSWDCCLSTLLSLEGLSLELEPEPPGAGSGPEPAVQSEWILKPVEKPGTQHMKSMYRSETFTVVWSKKCIPHHYHSSFWFLCAINHVSITEYSQNIIALYFHILVVILV